MENIIKFYIFKEILEPDLRYLFINTELLFILKVMIKSAKTSQKVG